MLSLPQPILFLQQKDIMISILHWNHQLCLTNIKCLIEQEERQICLNMYLTLYISYQDHLIDYEIKDHFTFFTSMLMSHDL